MDDNVMSTIFQNSQMDSVNSVPVSAPAAAADSSSVGGVTPMDVQQSSDTAMDVTSRLSMSDEQRQIKLRFEEKQRDEARRFAQADKLAKKKVPHVLSFIENYIKWSCLRYQNDSSSSV